MNEEQQNFSQGEYLDTMVLDYSQMTPKKDSTVDTGNLDQSQNTCA